MEEERKVYDQHYVDPETLDDENVFAIFLAKYTHVSMAAHSSVYAAKCIQRELSRQVDPESSEQQLAWHRRMQVLLFDSDALSDSAIDGLLSPESELYDEPFTAIYSTLRVTRERSQELKAERQALLLLKDLRIGAVRRGLTDEASTEKWMTLIGQLNPPTESDAL